jgi:hypothetical protein
VKIAPLWVVVPDVVADAHATLDLWRQWQGVVRSYHVPAAFVAQDGAESLRVPWENLACLFLGGSTAYKESDAAAWLIRKAKAFGKRVHIGRVNTERRLRLFDGLGYADDGYPLQIDSLDGTQFSMFPDTYIPRWCERLRPSLRGQLVAAAPLPMFEEMSDAA